MNFIKFNGLKKYLLIFYVLFSITITTETASAVTTAELTAIQDAATAISPWGIAMSGGGAIISTISAAKHDAMIESYFKQVLAAIEQLNRKLDLVIQNDCNIYQKSINDNFDTFKVRLESYLTLPNRSIFYNKLENLSFDLPALLVGLQDQNNLLVNCTKFNQFSSLVLYLLLTNIDLSIQAEYIRETYVLENGIPTTQMTPSLITEMELAIKSTLSIRLKELIKHLQLLDGTDKFGNPSTLSWRKMSDKRFSGQFNSWVDIYQYNYVFADPWSRNSEQCDEYKRPGPGFTFDGGNPYCTFRDVSGRSSIEAVSYTFDGMRYNHFKNAVYWKRYRTNGNLISARNTRAILPWGPSLKNSCYSVEFLSARSGCSRMTLQNTLPNFASAYDGDLSFMNYKQIYDHYNANMGLIYNRHKHLKYVELVDSELVPILRLVQNWISEVGNPDIKLPIFKAITDAENYHPPLNDPSYDDPNIPYPKPIVFYPNCPPGDLCL